MNLEIWPINKFSEYARNPRRNDAVVDRMVSSIREFGFKMPILARSNGEIVDGHLRLKAAKKLEIAELPVILADDLNEQQIKAFRLLANRSVQWAEWDDELLVLELEELQALEFDLSLTGFDEGELDSLIGGMDTMEGEGNHTESLADRFGVPPFSVLSARGGWWQDRKRAWLALGIQSELGRGESADGINATPGGIDACR